MENKEQLLNKLNKQVEKLENEINYRKLYNIRNSIMRALIKSGLAIDYIFPFILASYVGSSNPLWADNAPFRKDDIRKEMSVQSIDTSSGLHLKKISEDRRNKNESIEYSTGWIINDNGLYERSVTTYRINKKIDIYDIDRILSMTKEEIEKILDIVNIEKITKDTLSDDDYLYNEDALIVISHEMSDEYAISRKETDGENVLNTLFYFLYLSGLGNIFSGVKKLIFKTYLVDKLNAYEVRYRKISKDDLEEMRKILKLKKANIAMLSEEAKSFQYKLRKDIKG